MMKSIFGNGSKSNQFKRLFLMQPTVDIT